MNTSILTHLAAAVIPLLLVVIGYIVYNRIQSSKIRSLYWKRQSSQALEEIGFWDMEKMPELPTIITDKDSLYTALQTTSLVQELGLLKLFRKKQYLTEDQIADFLELSIRHTRAIINVIEASDIIQKIVDGYSLTDTGQMYFLTESPFYEPLAPPGIAKKYLKNLQSGRGEGTIKLWEKGESHLPEEWARQQHLYSFPLGFSLYQSGILQDSQQVLDVAGGAGSVCIALALKDPDLKLQMIELPSSIETAELMISKYNVTDRIEIIGMNMFTGEWPQENDTVLFTNIFHDWEQDKCQALAEKALAALQPGGLISLQEVLLNEDQPDDLWPAHFTLATALYTNGRQFYARELIKTLEAAGFVDVQVRPLFGYYSSVVGVKPSP